MSEKIEKEVKEEKNVVKGKKDSKVLILSILLVLTILSFVGYVLVDNEIIKFGEEKVAEEKVEEKTKLDIDGSMVKRLFGYVHRPYYLGYDENVFESEKKLVSEFSDIEKSALAANVYELKSFNLNNSDGTISKTVDEQVVKEAFEEIFGKDSYKKMDTIFSACSPYKYNSTNKNYSSVNEPCGGAAEFVVYEKIIHAYRYDDRIEITTKYLFNDQANEKCYKEYDKKTVLDNIDSMSTAEEFDKYIEKNVDKLSQYTYTFKLADDGNYYYYGFERNKK